MSMADVLAEEPTTPNQPPTLTELEEARAYVRIAERHAIESLMASEVPELQSVLGLFERPAWHAQAACRGADQALFFPTRGDPRSVQALAYCARCRVASECLAASLEVPGTVGVWAGTMQLGRRGLRRGVA
jgi:hypothetical protein